MRGGAARHTRGAPSLQTVAHVGVIGQSAAAEHNWKVYLAAVASIWRDGCIIRATFLPRPHPRHPLGRPGYDQPVRREGLRRGNRPRPGLPRRETITFTARRVIPVPAFAAAPASYNTLRAERLRPALIQGQRDYFGAHTYQRTDRLGVPHPLGADRPGRDPGTATGRHRKASSGTPRT
ncbi:hypothetical protein [Streptomyces sp. 2-1]|uniref:hypothetical protein n=1 Tax=Streptomyces sp. 2-1 TaxID=412710 RepID=UPI003AFA329E